MYNSWGNIYFLTSWIKMKRVVTVTRGTRDIFGRRNIQFIQLHCINYKRLDIAEESENVLPTFYLHLRVHGQVYRYISAQHWIRGAKRPLVVPSCKRENGTSSWLPLSRPDFISYPSSWASARPLVVVSVRPASPLLDQEPGTNHSNFSLRSCSVGPLVTWPLHHLRGIKISSLSPTRGERNYSLPFSIFLYDSFAMIDQHTIPIVSGNGEIERSPCLFRLCLSLNGQLDSPIAGAAFRRWN